MKYRGAYSDGTSYEVGDAVVFTDGIPYVLQKPAAVGTGCHNTIYWSRAIEEVADMITLFHSFLMGLEASAATAAATTAIVDTMLFDEKTLVLASSTEDSDKRYAVTVDDEDGLTATEIVDEDDSEEEAAEGGES